MNIGELEIGQQKVNVEGKVNEGERGLCNHHEI